MTRKQQKEIRQYAKIFYKISAEWYEMVCAEEFEQKNGEKNFAEPEYLEEMQIVRDMLLDVGKRLNNLSSAFVKKG